MTCPKCGYDNKPDALVCNLCRHMLRKERAAAARAIEAAPEPASAPAQPSFLPPRIEPPRIESAEASPPHAPEPRPAAVVHGTYREAPVEATRALTDVATRSSRGGAILLLVWALLFAGWGASLVVKRTRLVSFPLYPKTASAHEILGWPGYGYVRFDRNLLRKDASFYRVVHGGSTTFSSSDPRVGFDATDPRQILAQAKSRVGTYVRLAKPPPMLQAWKLTQYRTRAPIGHPAGPKPGDEVLGHRVFAPVLGTNGKLWVVSKWYGPKVEVKTDTFLASTDFAGQLVPLASTLEGEWGKLAQEYRQSMRGELPRDAVAILDEPPPSADSVTQWIPLGDSSGVFVEVPDDVDLAMSYPEGVVDLPSDGAYEPNRLAAFLSAREKKKIEVDRFRVIVLVTPERFKELRALPPKLHQGGVVLLGIGGAFLLAAIARFRRASAS